MDAAVAENIWQQDAAQHRAAQYPIFMAGCNCNIDHFDANTIDVFTLGKQNVVCTYCGALGFSSENYGTEEQPHFGGQCCNNGK
eukprot:10513972-Ditylum_brightwellii.AAC.1